MSGYLHTKVFVSSFNGELEDDIIFTIEKEMEDELDRDCEDDIYIKGYFPHVNSHELVEKIWEANKAYCEVEIQDLFGEVECISTDIEDYETWKRTGDKWA